MGKKTSKNGWQVRRFDEMATLVNDKIDGPSKAETDRYVGLEHLDPESLKVRRWGSPSDVEAAKLIFKSGDIIFGKRRAYQRKLAVADFDGICSAHAMVLRSKPEVALPEFLPFFMQSDLFMERAVDISVGSLSPTINWKTLATQEFDLPPLGEQRRLVEFLSSVESWRVATQTAARAAWRCRIAAYLHTTQRGRHSSGFKNSELGLIPADWAAVPIGEVLNIENRLRKPINAEARSQMPGPYPYHGPTGQLDSIGEFRLDGTYALIGEDGDHFLKHTMWSMTQLISGRFNVNNHAHVIAGTDSCLVEWFFHFYRHRDVRQWLTKQGSGRLKLKKATLVTMPIALPPVSEQEELIDFLQRVSGITESLERRLVQIKSLLCGFGNSTSVKN